MKHGILSLTLLVLIVIGVAACFVGTDSSAARPSQAPRTMLVPEGTGGGYCC